MLTLSRGTRLLVHVLFAIVALLVVVVPVTVLVVAALAASWNDVLPGELTTSHLLDATSGDSLASLVVSLQTAMLAALVSTVVGTWAALAARHLPPRPRAVISAVLHLPAAVPSVVVGLGVLTAFSGPPLMLGGHAAIVVLAQTILVLSFAFSTVSAAATRLDGRLSLVAASLGAPSATIVRRVELPLLLPAVGAAFGLALALSMGELGATIMVYPPSWRTLPVTIFTAADRGALFTAAANTLVLVAVTVVVLALVSLLGTSRRVRMPRRAARPVAAEVDPEMALAGR